MKPRSISIFTLFIIIGFCELLGLFVTYKANGPNIYVNNYTILLDSLLILENIFFLYSAKKSENVLVLWLVIWNLLYVTLRVITLNLTEYSEVLPRVGALAEDINNTIIQYIVFSFLLWMILKSKYKKSVTLPISSSRNTKYVLSFYWIIVLISLLARIEIPFFSDVCIFMLAYFVNLQVAALLIAVYYISNIRILSTKERILFLLALLYFAVDLMLGGSRAGLFVVIKIFVCVAFSLNITRVKIRYVLFTIAIIPFLILMFQVTTYMRKISMTESTISEKIELVKYVYNYLSTSSYDLAKQCGPVFDRIGFLDYTCEMNKRADFFRTFINVSQELKSIVDNALSPGFDVFDAPRISTTIGASYDIGAVTSQQSILKYGYHSDELTLLGELIVLFGKPLCYFVIILFALGLRKIWCKIIHSKNGAYKCALFLFLFDKLLASFGLDWLVIDTVTILIVFYLYKRFCLKQPYETTSVISSK